jgi:hypothetical protein
MGFVRNKVYRLVFDDPEMDGLIVKARSLPLGQLLKFTKMSKQSLDGLPADERIEVVTDLIETFAKALISWNLESEAEEGGLRLPVPATKEGLHAQDFDFVLEIIMAWMETVMSVSAPLGRRSSAGGPSLEASIPMEPLSMSLPT